MTLDEALKIVAAGGRVASNSIPEGWVVKDVEGHWRVVKEGSEDSYTFQQNAEATTAEWREVVGWASYG